MTPHLPESLERLPLDRLIPYANNSRTHSKEQVAQIASSIREFGFTNPILIDEADGIIAGHGRVLAARKLGLEEVPCIRLGHLTETQRKAYVIADNKLALNAGWDEQLLAVELSSLREVGFDLGIMGFDAESIEAALNPDEPKTCHADKKTQELMENSALIIIDFKKAMQLGYVKLKDEIAGALGAEEPDEDTNADE